jgi:hypothetical protein
MPYSSTFVARDEDTASNSLQSGRSWQKQSRGQSRLRIMTRNNPAERRHYWEKSRVHPPFDSTSRKGTKVTATSKKIVMDYNMERKAKDMKQFLDYNMPSYIEQVSGSLDKFEEKADRNGLPKAILFTSKAKTASMTKYLSTEFRRRLLIAEVYPTKPNKALMDKYGVTDLPALIVLPPANEEGIQEEPIRYEGGPDGFTKNKLQNFLSKHALKTKVPIKRRKRKQKPRGTLNSNNTSRCIE